MLSTTTEYAFRALAHLAGQADATPKRSQEIAQATAIPPNYLSKILQSLRAAGLLKASRGVGGGFALARSAEEIYLIDVAELFDGVRATPTCILGSAFACSERRPCNAHAEWNSVRAAFISFLESTTLASIKNDGRDTFGQCHVPANPVRHTPEGGQS